jgi:predicted outer membrane repeat protein
MMTSSVVGRSRSRRAGRSFESLENRCLLSGVVYVDAASPGTTQNGSSWATAYTSLAAALVAGGTGATFEIAAGTYKPTTGTDRTATFLLNGGVTLLGGFAGYGAANPDARDVAANPTILSGDIGTLGSSADNSNHVLTINASGTPTTVTLDGLTITGGNAGTDSGGGLVSSASNVTLSVTECTFLRNTATSGGAIELNGSTAIIDRSTFDGNTATSQGGAIDVQAAGSLTLSNSVFVGNAAPTGSALSVASAFDTTGPTATPLAASAVTINSDFVGDGSAHALVSNVGATFTSDNNVLLGQIATSNLTLGTRVQAGATVVRHTDISGGYAGTGNFDADPQFTRAPSPGTDGVWGTPDDDYGNLNVLPSSPLVNAGDSARAQGLLDWNGNVRVLGAAVDVGAIELQNGTALVATLTGTPTIINGATSASVVVSYVTTSPIVPSSLGDANIVVSGPNGFSTSAHFVSYSVRGELVTATYSFVPPGGAWSAEDDGTYTFALNAGQVTNSAGDFATGGTLVSIGVTVDSTPPTAALASVGAITAGASQIPLTISFADDTALDLSTIATGAISVTGPAGTTYTPTLVSVSGSGTSATATFSLAAPSGTLEYADDGTYTIATNPNAVKDAAGNPVATSTLGTFAVSLANTDPSLLVETGNASNTWNLILPAVTVKRSVAVDGSLVGGTKVTGTFQLSARLANGQIPPKKVPRGTPKVAKPNFGTIYVDFYVSTDAIPSALDTFVGTVKVGAFRGNGNFDHTYSFTVTLPSGITGNRQLVALVRPRSTVNQITTLDDSGATTPFSLTAPYTNVAVGSATATPAKPGKTTTLRFTVTNTSNTTFNSAVPITLDFLDSATQATTVLKSLTTRISLKPHQSRVLSYRVTVPTALTGHQGTAVVTLDPQGKIAETTHADDSASAALTIT